MFIDRKITFTHNVSLLIRALFAIILALLTSAIISHGNAYADDRPHNFTFVNTYTIAATCDGGPCYWILGNDSADLGSVAKNEELVFVRNTIPSTANLCNDVITYDTINKWGRVVLQKISGACATNPDPITPLSISNADKLFKYWYTQDGALQSVSGGGSTWKRIPGDQMASGGITGLKELYIQQGGDGCPDMVLGYSSGSWGFIAPQPTGSAKTDPVHVYYRQMVDATGTSSAEMGGCDAGAAMKDKGWSLNSLASNTGRSRDFFDTDSILGDSSGPRDGWMSFNVLGDVYKFSGQPFGTMNEVTVVSADGTVVPPSALGGTSTGTDGDEQTTCAVEAIGWLVCPVASFLANIADGAKDQVDVMMTVETADLFSNDGATKDAWEMMRSIANVLFIIAFLIVIYSQMTSIGISNYGIKKMIPRLIIAAILINISWYVAVAAIEISNVVGLSVNSFLSGLSPSGSAIPPPSGATSTGDGFIGWVGTALLLGVAGYFFLGTVLTVLLYAVVMILIMVILLGLRQALLILLVVLSPIAFTANLLPNTEGLFKKWWSLFKLLLVAFPIVGLMYGLGAIAGGVLMSSGEWQIQIFGIIALFAWIFVLKKTLEAATAVGGIGGMVTSLGNKGRGALEGKSKERLENSAFGQFRKFRKSEAANRRALTQSGAYTGRNPIRRRLSSVNSGINKRTGKFGSRMTASGVSLANKEWNEEMGRQVELITAGKNMTNEQIIDDMKNGVGSKEYQAALGVVIMKRNHRKSHLAALEAVRSRAETAEANKDGKEQEVVEAMQKEMIAAGGANMPWAIGDQARGALENGHFGTSSGYGNGVTVGEQMRQRAGTHMNAKTLSGLNPDELKSLHKRAILAQTNPNHREALRPDELDELRDAITKLRTDDLYKNSEKPNATGMYDDILNGTSAARGDSKDAF